MEDERYLQIFKTPFELGPNIEDLILSTVKEKYLSKEIQGKMITNIEFKDLNNVPLSQSFLNNIEINVPVKVIYKIYKPGDIIIGDLITDDKVFVISNDIICEIHNIDIVNTKTMITAQIIKIKHISGSSYFLTEGILVK